MIEDAAQALGAEYPFEGATAKAGTMGEVGTFSFYPSKNLGAAGDAGAVICQEKRWRNVSGFAASMGWSSATFHHFIGGNFRLDEIQAAILGGEVAAPRRLVGRAARVADVYREEFQRLGLTEPDHAAGRAVPGTRPDEPSHLSSICDPHSTPR